MTGAAGSGSCPWPRALHPVVAILVVAGEAAGLYRASSPAVRSQSAACYLAAARASGRVPAAGAALPAVKVAVGDDRAGPLPTATSPTGATSPLRHTRRSTIPPCSPPTPDGPSRPVRSGDGRLRQPDAGVEHSCTPHCGCHWNRPVTATADSRYCARAAPSAGSKTRWHRRRRRGRTSTSAGSPWRCAPPLGSSP